MKLLRLRLLDPLNLRIRTARSGDDRFYTSYFRWTIGVGQVMGLLTYRKLVDGSERLERFQLFQRIHAH
jgi:hypothetical protein